MMRFVSLRSIVVVVAPLAIFGCSTSSSNGPKVVPDGSADPLKDAGQSNPDNDAAAEAAVDAAMEAEAGLPCPIDEAAMVEATLKMTADDNFKLYVNGTLIDDTARIWSSPQTYTIQLFRHPGHKNLIAVEGKNTQQIDGHDRGIVVDVSFALIDGGAAQTVLSDTTWLHSTTMAADWFTPPFDDAAWTAAIDEGAHGMAPWGNVLGTSSAHWLWSFDSNLPAAQKTQAETVYFRKEFYLDMTGAPVATPPACP